MLCLLIATLALADPPQSTLDALGVALDVLDDPARVRSLKVLTTVVHSKPDGEDQQQEYVVTDVRNTPTGREVEVLTHLRDGQPVPREEEKDDGGGKLEVKLPGEVQDAYVFGPTQVRQGVCTARFEPAPSVSDKELAKGELAWDEASGRPLWVRFEPAKLPWMVQSLDNRIELAPSGPLHTTLVHSEGQGGVPGIRRRFAMDMVITDVAWVE